MTSLHRHKPYSRQQFEQALRRISRTAPFPKEWNEESKDGDRGPTTEYCYILPLFPEPPRILKIYSSVDINSNFSREVNGDAIRIVIANHSGQPVHGSLKRINRIESWEKNLNIRISEVLKLLNFNIECPNCKGSLYLRSRIESGHRFLGCSEYPKCTGSRSDSRLNIYLDQDAIG